MVGLKSSFCNAQLSDNMFISLGTHDRDGLDHMELVCDQYAATESDSFSQKCAPQVYQELGCLHTSWALPPCVCWKEMGMVPHLDS